MSQGPYQRRRKWTLLWTLVPIKDSRGRDFYLVDAPSRAEWRAFPTWRGRRRAIAAAGEPWVAEHKLASQMGASWGALIGLSLVLAKVTFARLLRVGTGLLQDVFASMAVVIMLPILVFPVFNTWARRKHRESLIAAYLSAGRCASCGYGVRPLTPDPAGFVTCPECGAAWELSKAIPPPSSPA